MPTQKEIAKHIGISERRVQDVLKNININDWQSKSMDEIRLKYIADLRDKAAGRGGPDQENLTRARTAEALASADLKILQVKEKAGLLVHVDEIEPQLTAMVTAARTELLSLAGKLTGEINALYGVEIDPSIIDEHINDALQHLAGSMPKDIASDAVAGVESVVTAA